MISKPAVGVRGEALPHGAAVRLEVVEQEEGVDAGVGGAAGGQGAPHGDAGPLHHHLGVRHPLHGAPGARGGGCGGGAR